MSTQQSFLIVVFANEFAGECQVTEVQALSEVGLELLARQVGFDLELCFSLQRLGQVLLLFVPREVDVKFVLFALFEVLYEQRHLRRVGLVMFQLDLKRLD
jgi:hypothetical protein